MDCVLDEVKATYSERVIASDVFTLIAKTPEKRDAFAISSISSRTTFYDYAKLLPLKALLLRQNLTRSQCFKALSIVSSLQKKYNKETINKILVSILFDDDFEVNATSLAKDVESIKKEINAIFIRNYDILEIDGFYLPIKEKTSKIRTEDKLLALSVWSISISQKGVLSLIQGYLPEEHYLKKANTRSTFLTKLISNLFRTLNVDIAYQATELLITTRTAYRNTAFELLKNGWIASE